MTASDLRVRVVGLVPITRDLKPDTVIQYRPWTFRHMKQWTIETVLPQYSKVSSGVCSLILHFHVLSTFIKKLRTRLHRQFLIITWQNIFFLGGIDRSHAFDFWKNISCFRYWWKTCTRYCTNIYVIRSVKRISLPAF